MPDRWGYHDSDGYHYWPSIVRAADFYGFDRHDPVYKIRTPYKKGRKDCPSCRLHDAADRNYPCDVQLARARDIEAEGYPATFCYRCSGAMPVREDQVLATCWYCEDPSPGSESDVVRRGATARVADGLGCTEALPRWMVDFYEGKGV